ncbi:hypothetical protein HK405_002144, partial [Cladochytrium tenue]
NGATVVCSRSMRVSRGPLRKTRVCSMAARRMLLLSSLSPDASTMWTRTSVSHRSLRKALPRPRPSLAPGTSPATSLIQQGLSQRTAGGGSGDV